MPDDNRRRRPRTKALTPKPNIMRVNYQLDSPQGKRLIKWSADTGQVIAVGVFGLLALGYLADKISDYQLKKELELVRSHMGSPEFQAKIDEARNKRRIL